MAKVLLIYPPWYTLLGMQCREVPLSLCSLSAVLRKSGHETAIYNADVADEQPQGRKRDINLEAFKNYQASLYDTGGRFWQEVGESMRTQHPDIVGIHMKTASFKSVINLATLVKRNNPKVPVIVGGPHPSMVPEDVLKHDVFDYVVLHEGELSMVELVDALAAGRVPTDVKGIAYRGADGKMVRTPGREAIKNLDELPFPDRDSLLHKEQYVPDSYGISFTSRGCPFECVYCDSPAFWGRKVRYRSPGNVIAELEEVHAKYGTRYVKFYDDTWTLNQKRGIEICETMIKSGLPAKGVTWQCTTRADCLGDDLARAMKAAGCAMVNIGLESASERILKIVKKGETKEEIEAGIRILQKHAIPVNLYVMMGLPTETEAEVEETMAFARSLNPNSLIPSIATPYPGTELFEMAKKDGFIQSDLDWAEFFHQSPKMGLSKDIAPDRFAKLKDRFLKTSDSYNGWSLRTGMVRRGSVLLLRDPRTFAKKLVRRMLPTSGATV